MDDLLMGGVLGPAFAALASSHEPAAAAGGRAGASEALSPAPLVHLSFVQYSSSSPTYTVCALTSGT
jgi:hypothetical protein